MKYFKDSNNQVYAFEEDGSQDDFISENLVPITLEEADALRFPPLTLEQLQRNALAKLPFWEAAERSSGVAFKGTFWLTTSAALQDIRDCMLAGFVPNNVWIDATRESVPMTFEELKGLWAEIVAKGSSIYERRVEMEKLILTLTEEELSTFMPGWPAELGNM